MSIDGISPITPANLTPTFAGNRAGFVAGRFIGGALDLALQRGTGVSLGLGGGTVLGAGGLGGGAAGDVTTTDMIALQAQVQRETAMFSAQSNVLKAHHDARMTAVRNVKG